MVAIASNSTTGPKRPHLLIIITYISSTGSAERSDVVTPRARMYGADVANVQTNAYVQPNNTQRKTVKKLQCTEQS